MDCISTVSFKDSCYKAGALTVVTPTAPGVGLETLVTKLQMSTCPMQNSQTNQGH